MHIHYDVQGLREISALCPGRGFLKQAVNVEVRK